MATAKVEAQPKLEQATARAFYEAYLKAYANAPAASHVASAEGSGTQAESGVSAQAGIAVEANLSAKAVVRPDVAAVSQPLGIRGLSAPGGSELKGEPGMSSSSGGQERSGQEIADVYTEPLPSDTPLAGELAIHAGGAVAPSDSIVEEEGPEGADDEGEEAAEEPMVFVGGELMSFYDVDEEAQEMMSEAEHEAYFEMSEKLRY